MNGESGLSRFPHLFLIKVNMTLLVEDVRAAFVKTPSEIDGTGPECFDYDKHIIALNSADLKVANVQQVLLI
jgi:hypothetical protein